MNLVYCGGIIEGKEVFLILYQTFYCFRILAGKYIYKVMAYRKRASPFVAVIYIS
jgi:hypothetical protein